MSSQKQQEIPGTERQSIAQIEEAAEEYRALRDERMQLSVKEATAQANLVAAMQAHGQKVYRYEDSSGTPRKVMLTDQIKAKVAKVKDGDGGSEAN